LLGNKYKIIESYNSRKLCIGIIKFPTALVRYRVEVMDKKEGQTRKFVINGKEFEMCNKDNLSFSGYHGFVYRDFIKGKGLPVSEAKKSVILALKLKK
jgi:hypothetical protein